MLAISICLYQTHQYLPLPFPAGPSPSLSLQLGGGGLGMIISSWSYDIIKTRHYLHEDLSCIDATSTVDVSQTVTEKISDHRQWGSANHAAVLPSQARSPPARVHTPSRPMFWATSTNHCHDIHAGVNDGTIQPDSPESRLITLSVLVCHLIVNRCAFNRNTLWVPVPALQDDYSLPGYCRTDHLRLQSPWYVELYSIPVFIVVHSDEPIQRQASVLF